MCNLVKQCVLPALPNLSYSQSQALPGSITTITCGDGYTLKGAATLTCDDNGVFDSLLPVCECKYLYSCI